MYENPLVRLSTPCSICLEAETHITGRKSSPLVCFESSFGNIELAGVTQIGLSGLGNHGSEKEEVYQAISSRYVG